MRTANPAFSDRVYTAPSVAGSGAATMTVNGTAEKSLLLLLLVMAPAVVTWKMFKAQSEAVLPLMGVGVIGGLILALVTIFRPHLARVTAPLYCVAEGLFLGAISALFEQAYPGIAFQAMLLTFGVFVSMLLLYRAGVLRATEGFVRGVVGATMGIMLVYVADLLLRLFGWSVPFIHDSGPIGILISLAIVTIAALNLILDFEFIKQGELQGFPKHMEWYGAFGLMVTIIWLYLEILRLLAKLRQR